MSVVETIYPDGDVASGAWNGSFADIDETGAHDGDTTHRMLQRVDTLGETVSEFEVSLANPTAYIGQPQVRDAESWKALTDLKVRDGESWKSIKALSVRDGESWKLQVPQITIRVTARSENTGDATASYEVKLKAGTTVLGTLGGSGSVGAIYAETSFSVDASTLIQNNVNPTDLRVAVEGTCTVNTEGTTAELRVTQVKVELND
jgi:hypothetical protein